MDATVTTEQVWETFHAQLRQFIRTSVPNEAVADDILQDVFLKVHTHIGTLRAEDRLVSWVYQITRRAITDHYRLAQRHDMTPLDDELVERLNLPDEGGAGEENAVEQSLLPYVRSLVLGLPEPYREALLLTEYEGLSQKELARRLGLSFSGAKSRVQRAREQIKQLLLECCHFEFDRRGQIIAYAPICSCCAEDAVSVTKTPSAMERRR